MKSGSHYINRAASLIIMISLALTAIFIYQELSTSPQYIPYIDNALSLEASLPSSSQPELPPVADENKDVDINISFIGNFSPASALGSDVYGTFNSFIRDIDTVQYGFKNITDADYLTVASCNAVLAPSESLTDIDVIDGITWLLGPEENAMIYNALGIDAVSLETEHIFDYTEAGKSATESALKTAGVAAFDSSDPLIFNIGNLSACILTARFSQESPGISGLVKIATSIYDIVIVYGEADDNSAIPSEWRISAAHEMIDAGADAVIQYTNYVQKVERYNDGVIAYSLGNFLDGSVPLTDDSVSLILSLNIKQSGSHDPNVSFLLIPCISSSDGWIPSPSHDIDHVEDVYTNE